MIKKEVKQWMLEVAVTEESRHINKEVSANFIP